MSVGSSFVIPVVLWGRKAPTHCVSAVLMTADLRNIITGCYDGQICIWDVTPDWQIFPRSMLFGHSAAICSLVRGSSWPEMPYIVSASDNGEMNLWDISDGHCIEHTKMSNVHSNIQAYQFRHARDIRLVCNGYYPEIFIIDPLSLEILYSLCSKVTPDWISACCVLRPVKREDDVIVAISKSGAVKVWSILGSEPRTKPIFEDESKQIRCLNAETLSCCQYNQRTVLIVCSKYWQIYSYDFQDCSRDDVDDDPRIYDASDFTLLCSESNRCGERWLGGDFVGVDRVIVWSNEGRGYLYRLPTNLLRGKAAHSATAGSADYHGHQTVTPHAYYVFDMQSQPLVCAPAITYHLGTRDNPTKVLLRGDCEGRLVVWLLPEVTEKHMTLVRQESFDRLPVLQPRTSTTLQSVWESLSEAPVGIIDHLHEVEDHVQDITATIYIPSQGQLVCGHMDGSIAIVPATQALMLQLLNNAQLQVGDIPVKALEGHEGKVTCLLYPFNESTRYEAQHLVSGGVDFSVCLWDIVAGTKLHTFCVHGGEISELIVPPNNCNTRILSCICSVASDHSVTLLSLKEKKCILLAGRHLFTVKVIKWRPLDDFMVVGCADGTVYVWQMETGHLDRVVHGITAEEILANCDENAMPVESLTNPTISLTQALKRRNLATFRNLAQQKLQAPNVQAQQRHSGKAELSKPEAYPMLIQGVRTNTNNSDSHVVFFDIEALIVHLLSEEYACLSPTQLEAVGQSTKQHPSHTKLTVDINEAQQKLAGFIAKVKDRAETMGQKIPGRTDAPTSSPPVMKKLSADASALRPDDLPPHGQSLTKQIARLMMSCVHAWGLDPDLDKLCLSKLGLIKPRCPISFGFLSRQGHMSLMLPGWHRRVMQASVATQLSKSKVMLGQATRSSSEQKDRSGSISELARASTEQKDRSGSLSETPQHQPAIKADLHISSSTPSRLSAAAGSLLQEETHVFTTRGRWQISSAVTTQHLLSVISVANTLMTMNQASFLDSDMQLKFAQIFDQAVPKSSDTYMVPDDVASPDVSGTLTVHQAQIKQGWSLLAALHCVLLPELVGLEHYQPPQLEMLARRWQDRCLEVREAAQALLLAELHRIGAEGRKAVVDEWAPFLPTYVDPHVSLMAETQGPAAVAQGQIQGRKSDGEDEDNENDDDNMLAGDSPVHRVSTTVESRRRQATAIVMLGVIGAEFGQEIQPNKRQTRDVDKKKTVQDGFGLTNYSLARHTSKALTFLLLQPASRRLPAHTSIRRAAMDLLGRGFTVWEPYLDVSAVLLGLLELCIDAESLVPSMTYGLPLSPESDSCRTARHALSLIATARPPAFIITMAKEVARYNALAQNAQTQHIVLHNSVLTRARSEILRVVELLVDKMPGDVSELLIEAMDVTVHCVDTPALRNRSLTEIVPAICKFSMASYCASTRRLCAGAKNGGLAFYELKGTAKCQVIPAHTGVVVAVSFSPDGKYVASYSHVDSRIKFWQTGSSSLFNLGSQQTRCIKSTPAPTCVVPPMTNIMKVARIVWLDHRTLVLLTIDGSETKFSV